MKQFLTKAIVALGVMASAMALSSVGVWAADKTHLYFVNSSDVPTGITNAEDFFVGELTGTNGLTGSVTIEGTTYNLSYRTASTSTGSKITFTIPNNYEGTFYIAARSNSDSSRTLTLTNTATKVAAGTMSTTATKNDPVTLLSVSNLVSGEYELTHSGNYQYSLLAVTLNSTSTAPATTISSITTSTGSTELMEGSSLTLSPVFPSGTSGTVTWASSNSAVASVDAETGVVTAGSVDVDTTVTITATLSGSDPVATKDIVLTVKNKPDPTGVTVTGSETSLLVGETLQLTGTITPDGAEGTLVWSSDDTSVASVSSTGLVTANTTGSATITATVDGTEISDSIDITVYEEPKATVYHKWAGSDGLVKGDNGNGLQALEAMSADSAGYMQGSGNPKVNGSNYSNNGQVPDSGAVIKFKTGDVTGNLNVQFITTTNRDYYAIKQTGASTSSILYKNATKVSDADKENITVTWSIPVEKNSTYYVFGTNTKLKYKYITFTPSVQATDSKAAVVNIDTDYYAVATISSGTASTSESFTIAESEDIDTIYKDITVDDIATFTADSFGGAASDYVYGFKLDITNTSGSDVTLEGLQEKLPVTFKAIED
ncbi:MAG: Ig-like domain-containing protein [Firmicutes bacterium]|nr:Ig-like domain-containing protein [Bacillota bacterium]